MCRGYLKLLVARFAVELDQLCLEDKSSVGRDESTGTTRAYRDDSIESRTKVRTVFTYRRPCSKE